MSRLIQSLRRMLGAQVKELVGNDQHGNKYYIMSIGGRNITRRVVEPPDLKFGYAGEIDNIPPEWRSWLVGRRETPPTPEEQENIRLYKESVAQNVMDRDESEKKTETKIIPNVGMDHASAKPSGVNSRFGEDETQPESIGDTFHPGKWKPTAEK